MTELTRNLAHGVLAGACLLGSVCGDLLLAGEPVEMKSVLLENSKFKTFRERGDLPAGVMVHPQGGLSGGSHFRYNGVVYAKTHQVLMMDRKFPGQRWHLRQEAYMVHWRAVDGMRKKAGVYPDGKRVFADIEIPATLLDKHTAYTALVSTEKEVRIESVVAVSANGKFVIREVCVTNTGKKQLRNVEFHEFANLPYMWGIKHYTDVMSYDKAKDLLLTTSESPKGLPAWDEVCGLAGVQRSASHSIGGGSLFGAYVARDHLLTGTSNNADKGRHAGIMVWALGDLAPGAKGSAAAIIAVGDNRADLDRELNAARSLYPQRQPLHAEADRSALLAKYARIDWQKRTHGMYVELINSKDPDKDGWDLAREKAAGTDPNKADTDGDGLKDFEDADPLQPEPVIAAISEQEVAKDRLPDISSREIIRSIKVQGSWHKAADVKELSLHLARLRNLRVNCVSLRVTARLIGAAYGRGDTLDYKHKDYRGRDLLAEYLAACHRYGIVHEFEGYRYVHREFNKEWFDKPGGAKCAIPGVGCCNSWIKGVIASLIFDTARYPIEAMQIVDEERYNVGWHGERFYTGTICYCVQCVNRFMNDMGYEMPGLQELRDGKPPQRGRDTRGRKYFELHRWRQRCATDAWQYWANMARFRNPNIRPLHQSVNEKGVYYRSGVGTDFTGSGLSGVDIGYKAGMYYGSDHVCYPRPFVLAETFNHFVYPGAVKNCMARVPTRKGWIVYTRTPRYFEPVWCYGQFISAVAHGAKAVEYWGLNTIARARSANDPKIRRLEGPAWSWNLTPIDRYEYVKMTFTSIKSINDWIFAAEPVKQVAFLWDGASDEVYSVLEESHEYALADPGIRQATCMTHLFRTGYPFDMFYLHYAGFEALKDYPVIMLPGALSIRKERVGVLERLVRNGASLIIVGEYGQLDYDGRPHLKKGADGEAVHDAALLELAGVEQTVPTPLATAPAAATETPATDKPEEAQHLYTGPLQLNGFLKGIELQDLQFRIVKGMSPAPGTEVLARTEKGEAAIFLRRLGKGRVVFMPGDFVAASMYPRSFAPAARRRSRDYDITKPGTKLMNRIVDHCLEDKKVITRYERIAPDANADLEIALLQRNQKDKTLFVLNWEAEKQSVVEVGLAMPRGKYRISEWSMAPGDKARIENMKIVPFVTDGKKKFSEKDLRNFTIELEPQQIRILHIEE